MMDGIPVFTNQLTDQTFEGMNNLFTLPSSDTLLSGSFETKFILMSFFNQTRVLVYQPDGSFEHLANTSFITSAPTISCSCIAESTYIQITPSSINLICFQNENDFIGQLKDSYETDSKIMTCHVDGNDILISLSSKKVMMGTCSLDALHFQSPFRGANQVEVSSLTKNKNLMLTAHYDGHAKLFNFETNSEFSFDLSKWSSDGMGVAESLLVGQSEMFIGLREGTCLVMSLNGELLQKKKCGNLPVKLSRLDADQVLVTSGDAWLIRVKSKNRIKFVALGMTDVLFSQKLNSNSLLYVTRNHLIKSAQYDFSRNLVCTNLSKSSAADLLYSCSRISKCEQDDLYLMLSSLVVYCVDRDKNQIIKIKKHPFGADEVLTNLLHIGDNMFAVASSVPRFSNGCVHLLQFEYENQNPILRSLCSINLPSPANCLSVYDKDKLIVTAGHRIILFAIHAVPSAGTAILEMLAQNMTRNTIFSVVCRNDKIYVTDGCDGVLLFEFTKDNKLDPVFEDRTGPRSDHIHTAALIVVTESDAVMGADRKGFLFLKKSFPKHGGSQINNLCRYYLDAEIITRIRRFDSCSVLLGISGSLYHVHDLTKQQYKALSEACDFVMDNWGDKLLLKPRYETRNVIDHELIKLFMEQYEAEHIDVGEEIINTIKEIDFVMDDI
ncbi:hypothetical protein AKO1_007613 [Acrasis kona]|uniref:RSE1/DDB1/CPSF1 second beta-propeller domain-containing protein n=1 Tax=Acrasis kona TaxID=1008807 RepID=A0AAW2YT43_9EUKA